jgi:hypothetical protein
MDLNTSKGKPVTSNSSARKMVEKEEMKKKAPDEPPHSGSTGVQFALIYNCGYMTVVQASLMVKQRDPAMKETYEGPLLKAKKLDHQIQASSMYGVEEDWTELNPRNSAVSVFSSRGMVSASYTAARKVVELQKHCSSRPSFDCLTHFYKRLCVTVCECRAPGSQQTCVEVACTMLCTMVVLVLAKIQSDNGAELGTAMEVTKTKLMFSEVAKHCSNTSAKKFPEIRRQAESLPEIAPSTQVSKASTLKTIADSKYAVRVVEQPKTKSEQKLSLTKGRHDQARKLQEQKNPERGVLV